MRLYGVHCIKVHSTEFHARKDNDMKLFGTKWIVALLSVLVMVTPAAALDIPINLHDDHPVTTTTTTPTSHDVTTHTQNLRSHEPYYAGEDHIHGARSISDLSGFGYSTTTTIHGTKTTSSTKTCHTVRHITHIIPPQWNDVTVCN